MADQVILLNSSISAFGMRVRIALIEKGIKYEHCEEDSKNKSDLLLKMNPVHKKIPTLIHNGKSVHETIKGVPWSTKGEEQEAVNKFFETFKILEEELGDGPYFQAETFGSVDISLITFCTWFHVLEMFGKFSMEAKFPKIIAWAKRCMQRESVARSLPDPKKIYEFVMERRKGLGLE
ncbi:glutathione S-transferase U19-like [Juglans microcarpa x Juglans regia]|uniref:glutathione S-transferase U19-like n=1 Tax=Juglans microcarpa x Juglans regia TaxID=2249226 RepID=UPI001B7EC9AD|nr:glutathione S-transferase U19-like [Juglans microcarpa x Juglans regia]